MSTRKEPKQIRTIRVVRSWLPRLGEFRYFTLYSDGTVEVASRKIAEQYEQAYGEKVQTIVGKPEETTWPMTMPSSTGK